MHAVVLFYDIDYIIIFRAFIKQNKFLENNVFTFEKKARVLYVGLADR